MSVSLIDTQSLVQLSVALNFAFAAFESLRTPAQARMRRLAAETLKRGVRLSDELRSMHYISTFAWPEDLAEKFRGRSADYSKATLHTHNLQDYETAFENNIESWSFWIGIYAIVVGIFGLAVLIAIPLNDQLIISIKVYAAASVFLLSPAIFLIIYNFSIARLMIEEIIRIKSMNEEIEGIDMRLKKEYRPILERAKKDGYLK